MPAEYMKNKEENTTKGNKERGAPAADDQRAGEVIDIKYHT